MACHDVQLPELVRDRHVFAFSDGIYLAAADRFVAYGSPGHAALPSDLVAAKYFALPFYDGADSGGDYNANAAGGDYNANAAGGDADWYAGIPTPHLQSILDYQEMGEDVSRWMYAMIGRLIYEVGELDGWQVTFSLGGGGLCRAPPPSKSSRKTGDLFSWGWGPLPGPTPKQKLEENRGCAPGPLSC